MLKRRKEPGNGRRGKIGFRKLWDAWLIQLENKIKKKRKRTTFVFCSMLLTKIGKLKKKNKRKKWKLIKEIKRLGKHWLYKCKKEHKNKLTKSRKIKNMSPWSWNVTVKINKMSLIKHKRKKTK